MAESTKNIGRVVMQYRGEYSKDTTYTKLDVIYQDSTNSSYISLQNNNLNKEPKDNPDYWGIISKAKYELGEDDIKDAITEILAGKVLSTGGMSLSNEQPSVDFYYNNSSTKTSSIVESSKGTLQIPGNLTVTGGLNGNASSAKVLDHAIKINGQSVDTTNGNDNAITANPTLNTLKAGTDLSNTDNYVTLNGVYGLSGKYVASPSDTTTWNAILMVNSNPSANYVRLTFFDITPQNTVYMRSKVNGTWSAWTKVTIDNDLAPYQKSAEKIAAAAAADTAKKLASTVKVGGVSFDGSADVNLPGVNTKGNQDTTGNAATATKLATAHKLGGVAFDGSANVNLPGVNTKGNQDTTGNAATATKLATARTITVAGENSTGNATFDGSGNVTINTSRSFTESNDIAGPNGIKFHFYRYGDEVVIAAGRGDKGSAWAAYTQSDSIIIPEGFRPKYEIVVPGIRDDGSGMLGFVVQPSGRIYLRATTLPAGKGFYLRAPYPAAIS